MFKFVLPPSVATDPPTTPTSEPRKSPGSESKLAEESTRYPITIDWPEDTPIEMVGDNYTVDLFTGRRRAIYHTRTELAAAVYGIAMCKEAMALGGVISLEH